MVDDSTVYGVGLADEWAEAVRGRRRQDRRVARRPATRTPTSRPSSPRSSPPTPDIVYYGGIYNSGALLSKQLKEGGVKVPLMGGDGIFDPEFIKLAGAANAEGDLATSVGLPVDKMPKGQEFIAASRPSTPARDRRVRRLLL